MTAEINTLLLTIGTIGVTTGAAMITIEPLTGLFFVGIGAVILYVRENIKVA